MLYTYTYLPTAAAMRMEKRAAPSQVRFIPGQSQRMTGGMATLKSLNKSSAPLPKAQWDEKVRLDRAQNHFPFITFPCLPAAACNEEVPEIGSEEAREGNASGGVYDGGGPGDDAEVCAGLNYASVLTSPRG